MLGFFIGFLTVVLVLVSGLTVLIVLMQRPKQEGLGAAFGAGVTDQMWGAQTTNVLQKATVYLAILFFAITMILAVLVNSKQKGMRDFNQKMTASTTPAVPTTAPAANAPPLTPESVKFEEFTPKPAGGDAPITVAPKPAGDTSPITITPKPAGETTPAPEPPKPAGETTPAPVPPKPAGEVPAIPPADVTPEPAPAPAETGDAEPAAPAPAPAPAEEEAKVESGDAIEKLLEELNANPDGAAIEAVEEAAGEATDKAE